MTTRAEAIAAAGEALAQAELGIREGTVTEAAARSYGYVSGRYSLAEMERRIAAIRAADRNAEPTSSRRHQAQRALDKSA